MTSPCEAEGKEPFMDESIDAERVCLLTCGTDGDDAETYEGLSAELRLFKLEENCFLDAGSLDVHTDLPTFKS